MIPVILGLGALCIMGNPRRKRRRAKRRNPPPSYRENLQDVSTAIAVRQADTPTAVVSALLSHPRGVGVIGAWLDLPMDTGDDLVELKAEAGEDPHLNEVEAEKLRFGGETFRAIYESQLNRGIPSEVWDTATCIKDECSGLMRHYRQEGVDVMVKAVAFYETCPVGALPPRPRSPRRLLR